VHKVLDGGAAAAREQARDDGPLVAVLALGLLVFCFGFY
jgi:hypothetical protein